MALNTLMNQASIVIIGSFNPKIFHPEWLINKEIIGEFNFNLPAKKFVVAHDIASYDMSDEMNIQVTRNRLMLKSFSVDSYSTIGDIAVSIVNILSETPILELGLNLTVDIGGFSQEKWKLFGEKLVHLEIIKESMGISDDIWEEKNGINELSVVLPVIEGEGSKFNFRMAISPRADQYDEKRRVLEIDQNQHYDLGESGGKKISGIITNEWDNVIKNHYIHMRGLLSKTIGETL